MFRQLSKIIYCLILGNENDFLGKIVYLFNMKKLHQYNWYITSLSLRELVKANMKWLFIRDNINGKII